MGVNLNQDGKREAVATCFLSDSANTRCYKTISKKGRFSPFIDNWLPVILREALLLHQEADFTSGCSQEKATAPFLVASLLSAPTRASIEGYVTLTQPEGNESSSDKRDLINNPSILFCIHPHISFFYKVIPP